MEKVSNGPSPAGEYSNKSMGEMSNKSPQEREPGSSTETYSGFGRRTCVMTAVILPFE